MEGGRKKCGNLIYKQLVWLVFWHPCWERESRSGKELIWWDCSKREEREWGSLKAWRVNNISLIIFCKNLSNSQFLLRFSKCFSEIFKAFIWDLVNGKGWEDCGRELMGREDACWLTLSVRSLRAQSSGFQSEKLTLLTMMSIHCVSP